MKKLFAIGITLLFLTSCSSAQANNNEERFTNEYNDNLHISTDTKTGCKYLIFEASNRGGITPLLNSDGKPDCGK
jgi:predicted nucleic acid-binding protein